MSERLMISGKCVNQQVPRLIRPSKHAGVMDFCPLLTHFPLICAPLCRPWLGAEG